MEHGIFVQQAVLVGLLLACSPPQAAAQLNANGAEQAQRVAKPALNAFWRCAIVPGEG